MDWLKKLGKDNRGSRPRCVLLTEGSREEIAGRLTRIVARPEVLVSPDDQWQPRGTSDVREAQLDKRLAGGAVLLSEPLRRQLKEWWLVADARTPNWDIASTCTISGDAGLLLVEAKAHAREIQDQDKCHAKGANRRQIERALEQANAGLGRLTGGSWHLSTRRRYQLSNRFAWSWKLAALGVPVVLIYVGFLNAEEMRGDGELFRSGAEWEGNMLSYSSGTVDAACWSKKFHAGGASLLSLIRIVEQPFGS